MQNWDINHLLSGGVSFGVDVLHQSLRWRVEWRASQDL